MDQLEISGRIKEFFIKYRYVILVVLLGVALMCFPTGKKKAAEEIPVNVAESTVERELEDALAHILSQIKGAGKVEVLLTEASGAETMYQSDTHTGSDTGREDTVIISGSDRSQTGLVRQVNPPSYMGAIVVCQGADSASVRLAIVQAVSSVTGLGADHITVLKMK